MTGSGGQIEWAERIRTQLDVEFNRVRAALLAFANQASSVEALIAILEEKRIEVMSHDKAGYFIHQWQEPADKVRLMILRDPRYAAIRDSRQRQS